MSSESQPSPLNQRVVPRVKVWLETDGEYVFGRGISKILKAVEETGSIKAAAEKIGKSYRFVWSKVKETEQTLGAPLVRTQVGGGDARRSELTDLARDLIREFDTLREQVSDLVNSEFHERLQSTVQRHQVD
jgi:molybdate transport system regulatory protein